MNKPSQPAAPDYQALASQQGQQNIDMAKMNNPNVVGPYGTQTVTYGGPVQQTEANFDPQAYLKAHPDVAAEVARNGQSYVNSQGQLINPVTSAWQHYNNYGKQAGYDFTPIQGATGIIPTITQTLDPAQQHLLDQQNQVKGMLGDLALQGGQSLQGIVGKPLDLSGLPAMPQDSQALRNQAIDAAMSRVNEDYGRQSKDLNSKLIAAGIRPGSTAYDNQMNLLNRGVNDARQQAILNAGSMAQQAYGMDMQSRNQALSELLAQRQMPLNEVSALMSGSQVTNPFAQAGVGGTNANPSPYFQAGQLSGDYATDLYNAKAAQTGGINQGLFGLGSAGLMALAAL